VRIEPRAYAQGPVTHDTVPLHVAADAPAQASLGFEGVVPRSGRRVAPDGLWRVEPSTVSGARRARLGHAGPEMAVQTEALLEMAALAPLRAHARLDGVHVQVVVRMNRSRANSSIVAVGTECILVAARAERRIIAGNALVPREEVGRVFSVPQPWRRVEDARCEHRLQTAAGNRRMARVARTSGVAARGGIGHRVAAKAPPHSRKLVPSGQV
jgi:hypothetical protein